MLNSREIKDIIAGRELKIQMILEKWNISNKDIDEIFDQIAKIEAESVSCYKVSVTEAKYRNEHNYKEVTRPKGSSDVKPLRKPRPKDPLFEVHRDGRFVTIGDAILLNDFFGINKEELDKIEDEGIVDGYGVKVIR